MANQTSITLVNGGSFSDAGFSWHGTMNVTNGDLEFDFPLDYRIIATFMHLTILLLGVTGNIVVIVVARSAASLQSSTYCYLVRTISCARKRNHSGKLFKQNFRYLWRLLIYWYSSPQFRKQLSVTTLEHAGSWDKQDVRCSFLPTS